MQIDDVLTPRECDDLVSAAQRAGFCPARLQHEGRLNEEVFLSSARFAALIRERLPAGMAGTAGDDVIEVYRYAPGCYLAPHVDLPRRLACGIWSNATLIVFLSGGFEGGCTRFPKLGTEARPSPGGALLFMQSLMHEGTIVAGGTKIIARLDVAVPVAVPVDAGKPVAL